MSMLHLALAKDIGACLPPPYEINSEPGLGGAVVLGIEDTVIKCVPSSLSWAVNVSQNLPSWATLAWATFSRMKLSGRKVCIL